MKGVEGRKELQKKVISIQQRTRTRTRKYKLSRRREPQKSSKGVEGRKELQKNIQQRKRTTRPSKQCGFCNYLLD